MDELTYYKNNGGNAGRQINVGSISISGGQVNGDVVQSTNYYGTHRDSFAKEELDYEEVPKWRSPFTQAVLAWLGVAPMAGTMIGTIVSFIRSLPAYAETPLLERTVPIQFIVLAAATLLLLPPLSLLMIAKTEQMVPLFGGWAIDGFNHRITIAKVIPRKCGCGAKMKYRNKTTEWQLIPTAIGSIRRKPVAKEQALVCVRNPELHWVRVDPAARYISS
jgi:hypothetical protein